MTGERSRSRKSLKFEQEWMLKSGGEPSQKADSINVFNEARIVGERQRQKGSGLAHAIHIRGHDCRSGQPQDGYLRKIDSRSNDCSAEFLKTSNGEGAVLAIPGCRYIGASFGGQVRDLVCEGADAFPVGGGDDWYDKAARRVDGHTDIDIALEDDLFSNRVQ